MASGSCNIEMLEDQDLAGLSLHGDEDLGEGLDDTFLILSSSQANIDTPPSSET
jgi:hypothetical protein